MRAEPTEVPTTIHVVSHTHWDREWYLPAARFRQQLVALVDELIDEPPAPGSSFLLDGQMVVIEDYLDVRPERHEALARMLSTGSLEAGPWYVLADELIPGGEALVRNLLAGKNWLERVGASAPPVLYCPDSFGHPAAMPTLAAGFGLDLVVASRGFGGARWPQADAVRWVAPSGEHAVLYHLSRKGYDIGENLPPDSAAAHDRWSGIRTDLLSRAKLGIALLPNGADHHARQAGLGKALEAMRAAAVPHDLRGSSLAAFARDAVAAGHARRLDEVRGELRDSYGYMWTLQGTFATRAHQKRRNAAAERLLTRDAEPWAALSALRGGRSRDPLLNAAWRSVLLCHPHDTLCGCSTDEVARAMDARLDEAHSQAEGIRDDAIADLIGHNLDAAREHRSGWKPMAVVRNAVARPRGGVALLRLTSFASDVKVGANASPGPVETARASTPALAGVGTVQTLRRFEAHERTEAPRHYPDDDVVLVSEVAAWIPEVPAYGVRCFAHQSRSRKAEPANPVSANGREMSNGLISVTVAESGVVSLMDHRTGRGVPNLLQWESHTDLGDLYTQSIRGARFDARLKRVRLVHKGPVRAAIETEWAFGGARDGVTVTVRFIVDANAPFVRVQVSGMNAASDHRLRIGLATDVEQGQVLADAMFGPVARRDILLPPADAAFEAAPRTAPLHRYVSVFDAKRGATVYSDGLAEYEATDGVVFVTLVRSVCELSRNDMPERPGHAGWPTHTPEAQCHGLFAGEFAVMLHGPDSAKTRHDVEQTSDDVLLPLTGMSLRSALSLPAPIDGFTLSGVGLGSPSIKPSRDGGWIVLRCVNVTESATEGSWRFGGPLREARASRLDESPSEPLDVRGSTVSFRAGPRAVVTLLVR